MPEARPHVLLVEGPDDKHVVLHLCQRAGLGINFYIKEKGGIDALLSDLGVESKASGLETLGILVDANDSLSSRWQAVSDRLNGQGIHLPPNPSPNGTMISGAPSIGIWVMPNNQTSGELENFISCMIPDSDSVWPLARIYVESIPNEHRRFKDGKILRAEVHAWLAVREDPRPMGLAIGAQDLDVDGPLTQRFLQWLRHLFP